MHYPGPPATTLSVTVHSGRDLPSGDFFKKSDPYIKVNLGNKEEKTAVKKGDSAVWEQTFTFNYTNETSIKFALWDKDMLSDDYLAVHSLSLLPILTLPDRQFSGELQLTNKKGKNNGFVRVTISFYPKAISQAPTPAPTPATPAPKVQAAAPPTQQVVQAAHPGFGVPVPSATYYGATGQPYTAYHPQYPPGGAAFPPQGSPYGQQFAYQQQPGGYPSQQPHQQYPSPHQQYPSPQQQYPSPQQQYLSPQPYPQPQAQYPPAFAYHPQQQQYPPAQQPPQGYQPQHPGGYWGRPG